jgi:hypothetical protein
MRNTIALPLVAATLLLVSACQADREATEGVPLDKNPVIEEAPAAPIPPVGIPVGRAPDTTAASTVDLDTIGTGQDTIR